MAWDKVIADTERSEFNMAIATLMRIDELLKQCNFFSRDGDAYNWWHTLLNLEREVDSFLDDGERKMIEKHKSEVLPALTKWQQQKTRGGVVSSDRLFTSLHFLEKILRRLMKMHGLYAREKEDPRMAVYG